MAWIITKDSQFYLHDNETLLAGLQRVGVVADFECQQGYCGTCKKKFKAMNEQTQLHYPSPPLVMLMMMRFCRVVVMLKGFWR